MINTETHSWSVKRIRSCNGRFRSYSLPPRLRDPAEEKGKDSKSLCLVSRHCAWQVGEEILMQLIFKKKVAVNPTRYNNVLLRA